MLAGYLTLENLFGFAAGIVGVVIGIDLIRPNSAIERAVLGELRRTRAGRASANAYRRWTTVLTGVISLLGGGTMIVASLVTEMTAR